jgi:hypothetical protein
MTGRWSMLLASARAIVFRSNHICSNAFLTSFHVLSILSLSAGAKKCVVPLCGRSSQSIATSTARLANSLRKLCRSDHISGGLHQ